MLHEVPDASCDIRIYLAFLLTFSETAVDKAPRGRQRWSSPAWNKFFPRVMHPPKSVAKGTVPSYGETSADSVAWVHQGSTSGDPKFRSGYQILPW